MSLCMIVLYYVIISCVFEMMLKIYIISIIVKGSIQYDTIRDDSPYA